MLEAIFFEMPDLVEEPVWTVVPTKGATRFAADFAFGLVRFFIKALLTFVKMADNMVRGSPIRQGGNKNLIFQKILLLRKLAHGMRVIFQRVSSSFFISFRRADGVVRVSRGNFPPVMM